MSTANANTAAVIVAANAALVDSLVEKYRAQVTGLVNDGVISEGAVLTQSLCRIEYESGKHVDWVSNDGQVFNTKSSSTEFERPMAPVIPSALKKVGQGNTKDDEKAEAAIRKMLRGFVAVLETGVFLKRGWSRTLPGITGKRYANGRAGEIQKYVDANEKVGL